VHAPSGWLAVRGARPITQAAPGWTASSSSETAGHPAYGGLPVSTGTPGVPGQPAPNAAADADSSAPYLQVSSGATPSVVPPHSRLLDGDASRHIACPARAVCRVHDIPSHSQVSENKVGQVCSNSWMPPSSTTRLRLTSKVIA
jgi:hypothetical protein